MRGQFGIHKEIVSLVTMVGLAPVLLAQRNHVKRSAVKLAAAPGPQSDAVPGRSPTLRMAILGESSALGVGVTEHADSMGPQLAGALAARTGRRVEWMAFGNKGARLGSIRRRLAPELGKEKRALDLVFLLAGVNDTLKLTSLREFRAQVRGLISEWVRPGQTRWVISSLPPLGRFRFMPQPLRFVIGGRAELLDRELQRAAAEHDQVSYAPVVFPILPNMLAEDGFHPSKAGYADWARQLANAACEALIPPER